MAEKKKFFVVFIVYAIDVLIDAMLMLVFTGGNIKLPLPQIYACGVSLATLSFMLVLERTIPTDKNRFTGKLCDRVSCDSVDQHCMSLVRHFLKRRQKKPW